jgi:hypothetical protein
MTIHAREAPETSRSSSSADTVREAAETAEDLSRTRPVINAADGNLERLGEATWAAIVKANDPPKIFRVGTVPSRLENADDGAVITKPLDTRRMRHYLAGIAEWVKIEDGNPKPVHPPSSAISYVLATPDPPLPVLSRIVEAPVFAPDGSIHTEPGYDPAARLWFAPPPGFEIPPVSEQPSPIEIKKAIRLVGEPIWDFPFVSQADKAHAIAYLLLPFVRELIDGSTPLHLVEKPGPGTGAGLLVDCLAYPSLGDRYH